MPPWQLSRIVRRLFSVKEFLNEIEILLIQHGHRTLGISLAVYPVVYPAQSVALLPSQFRYCQVLKKRLRHCRHNARLHTWELRKQFGCEFADATGGILQVAC